MLSSFSPFPETNILRTDFKYVVFVLQMTIWKQNPIEYRKIDIIINPGHTATLRRWLCNRVPTQCRSQNQTRKWWHFLIMMYKQSMCHPSIRLVTFMMVPLTSDDATDITTDGYKDMDKSSNLTSLKETHEGYILVNPCHALRNALWCH